jgi:hypothetical protein
MDRALARDPEARYPTVTGFAEAVSAITRGDAVATRPLERARVPAALPLPPTRQASRARARAGIPLLVATGATIAVAVAWVALQPDPEATAPAPPPAAVPASLPPSAAPTPPPPAPLPVSAPAAPVTQRDTGSGTAEVDTLVPEPDSFDDPARRQALIARATRIMNSPGQPPWRRALAAATLASVALKFGDKRSEALALYQRAQELFPNPRYADMIRQLQDSVPE